MTAIAVCLADNGFWDMTDQINPNIADGSQWLFVASDTDGHQHVVWVSNKMEGQVKALGDNVLKWAKSVCATSPDPWVGIDVTRARELVDPAWQALHARRRETAPCQSN